MIAQDPIWYIAFIVIIVGNSTMQSIQQSQTFLLIFEHVMHGCLAVKVTTSLPLVVSWQKVVLLSAPEAKSAPLHLLKGD